MAPVLRVRGMPMPDKHAFLSPSSSVRWYPCPPSARLCEQFPDQGSVYASEGTEAHRLCEYLLNTALGRPDVDPRPSMQYYTPEMEEAASGYVQFIMEEVFKWKDAGMDPEVYVEQRVDLRRFVPECMGTADCMIVTHSGIQVIDFKYGMHPVPASSMQLRLYALGACELFLPLYDFVFAQMIVYQPRLNSVDYAEAQVDTLYQWAREELAPRARQAFDGVGEFSCGDWCRLCRARRNCRALAEYELQLAQYDFADPALLSDEEIAKILSRADDFVSWVNSVKEFALESALKGHGYPGFKLVEGRAIRRFTDDAAVAERVSAAGADPWEKKLLGVPAMEKLLGKKKFSELLSDLVSRPIGKPNLVPESDSRPVMNVASLDFKN